MPFYVGDYLRDTGHLSTLQSGAYCLLLFAYWSRGNLPDDEQQLANITRMTLEEFRGQRAVLQSFFHDGWKHVRVDAELRRTADKIAKAREHGQKGGQVAALNREVNRHKLQQLDSGRNGGRYSKR